MEEFDDDSSWDEMTEEARRDETIDEVLDSLRSMATVSRDDGNERRAEELLFAVKELSKKFLRPDK